MGRYILRRLLESILVLFMISVVVFIAMQLAPGDPALVIMGVSAADVGGEERLQEIRREMGLDEPIVVQYFHWLKSLSEGGFGQSIRSGEPVLPIILAALPATFELLLLSLIIGITFALPAALISVVKFRSTLDYAIGVVATCGIAIPNFWLGILLITILSVHLGWLPASGYVPFFEDPIENLRRALLPSFTLGSYLAAYLTRFLRTDLLEALGQDYVRTAQAKGLTQPKVLLRHVLPNALGNTLTILGILVGGLLGGSVIIEQVFGWSGVGWLAVGAVLNQDYPIVQGVVLLAAAIFLLINLLVDVCAAIIDPRIRERYT